MSLDGLRAVLALEAGNVEALAEVLYSRVRKDVRPEWPEWQHVTGAVKERVRADVMAILREQRRLAGIDEHDPPG